MLQRSDDPKDLDEAIKRATAEKESNYLKPFQPFTAVTTTQLRDICTMILRENYVTSNEESILEQAWRSHGQTDDLTKDDAALWTRCASRGADVKNVYWLNDLRGIFATLVRDEAAYNLERNTETIKAEATKLGVGIGDTPDPQHSDEADRLVRAAQVAATDIKQARGRLAELRNIPVGYQEPSWGKDSPPGGGGGPDGDKDIEQRVPATFDPASRPFRPPDPGQAMATWDAVNSAYTGITDAIAKIADDNPAVYALVAADTNDPTAAGGGDKIVGKSVEEARAEMAKAFKTILGNIESSSEELKNAAGGKSSDLGFENLTPVQDKILGTKDQFKSPFAKAAAKEFVIERSGDAAKAQKYLTIATMTLLLAVEIGTGGAASPVIGTVVALTTSAVSAVDSWQKWAALDSAARSTVSSKGAIANQDEADAALLGAVIATAVALLDVYGFSKAVHSAVSAAKVAGLEAKVLLERQLSRLSELSQAERAQAVTSAVESQGIEATTRLTSKSASELAEMAGTDTAIGKKLTAYAAAAGTGVKPAAELRASLGALSTLSRDEAEQTIGQSIDVLGPVETLTKAGSIQAVEKAVGAEAASALRLKGWRDALVAEVEHAVGEVEAGNGAAAAKGYLATRTGVAESVVEYLLNIAVIEIMDAVADAERVRGAGQPYEMGVDMSAPSTPVQQVQRQMTPPPGAPTSGAQALGIDGSTYETFMKQLIGRGGLADQGLPRMIVISGQYNPSGWGFDGIGMRMNGDNIEFWIIECKYVEPNSNHIPELHPTRFGSQTSKDWAENAARMLLDESSPFYDEFVAADNRKQLQAALRRKFGNRFKPSMMGEALIQELASAKVAVVVPFWADISVLVKQRAALIKEGVRMILVRSRRKTP